MQAKLTYQTSHPPAPAAPVAGLYPWRDWCPIAPQIVLKRVILAAAGDKPGLGYLRSDPVWPFLLRLK